MNRAMKGKILITGAGSMLAKSVAEELGGQWGLVYLTTRKSKADGKKFFYWNTQTGEINEHCMNGVVHILHLAGFSINSRWSEENKKLIRESRVAGARMLFKCCKSKGIKVDSFTTASGAAVYGEGFLADVCKSWEEEADRFSNMGARVVKLRLPVLISKNSGFINTVKMGARWGVAVSFGRREMEFPWAHPKDVARFISFAFKKKLEGAFDIVASIPTQEELQKEVVKHFAGFSVGVRIPAAMVRIIFGEKSSLLLDEQKLNVLLTRDIGFKFLIEDLNQALNV